MTPQYYQKHKEEILLKRKQYYAANKEKIRVYQQTQRQQYPRKVKDANMRARHGISLHEYEQRFYMQGGICKICQCQLFLDKASHLDHDHLTGQLRGFLCVHCNKGLGRFKDNSVLLKQAINYLAEYAQCL